jgi:CheY-like chemotaxis protein
MTGILVLEDEHFLTKFLRKIFHGHQVLGAANAEEALLLRSEMPELPVILTSGYPMSSWTGQDAADFKRLRSDSVIVLQKPVETQRLLNCVRELIGAVPEVAKTA